MFFPPDFVVQLTKISTWWTSVTRWSWWPIITYHFYSSISTNFAKWSWSSLRSGGASQTRWSSWANDTFLPVIIQSWCSRKTWWTRKAILCKNSFKIMKIILIVFNYFIFNSFIIVLNVVEIVLR